jgi:apolipoprotein N-acyltransferase
LWIDLPGAQFADVIGFEGLNLVTLGANALFAMAWLTRQHCGRWRPALKWVGAALGIFFAVQLLGLGRAEPWKSAPMSAPKSASKSLQVLAVQGNVGNFDTVRLAFAWTKSNEVPLIFGQTNFFMAFRVCFFRAELYFEVAPVKKG